MKYYKFQIGDRVLYWPFIRGVFNPGGVIGVIVDIGSTYSILWEDEKKLISGYSGTYLVLVPTAIEKLDEIL